MKSNFARPLLAVGLLLFGLTACQSDFPTSPDSESIEPSAVSGSPAPLLGTLLGGSNTGATPTLVRVRQGQTLSPEDATLSFLERALSFPSHITKGVDGSRYMSFKFGPSGLIFRPAALLAIRVDKADLRGIDPRDLKIAVASDDEDDWQVVGGVYVPLTGMVVAPVLHFSRYALCVD